VSNDPPKASSPIDIVRRRHHHPEKQIESFSSPSPFHPLPFLPLPAFFRGKANQKKKIGTDPRKIKKTEGKLK
jgi:hypothetical protein